MKKSIVLLFISLLVLCQFSCVFAVETQPEIISQAALLIDNKTEKILYEKNANEKMYPASTTKIMTAILTLENCSLDQIVTISYDVVMSIPDGYSSASLQVGEQLTVEQLLQLLLVPSANDAANALAEHVGGSVESFVSMMNTKANELGLSHTHFTNSFGMHNEDHYTTAHDLAMLMKYCIQNEHFRRISGSASCALPATNKYGPRRYSSTNEMIIPRNPNYYSSLTCGKTGYTTQAGDCLVSCAYQDNLELICVILGGQTIHGISTRFSETKTLYEYAYGNYSIQNLLNENDIMTQIEVSNGTKETKHLDLLADTSIDALLENTVDKNNLTFSVDLKEKINAPIEEGETLGKVSYTIDSISYETDLIASHSVEESKILGYVLKIGLGLLIVFFVYTLLSHKKKKVRRRRRIR